MRAGTVRLQKMGAIFPARNHIPAISRSIHRRKAAVC